MLALSDIGYVRKHLPTEDHNLLIGILEPLQFLTSPLM